MKGSQSAVNRIVPFAVEASWATGRWSTLQKYLGAYTGGEVSDVFNLGVASALLCLHGSDDVGFRSQINLLREKIGATLSYSTTTSLQASHEARLHCHVLSELELIAGAPERPDEESNHHDLMIALERRLEVIGAFVGDKQYLLGIRRAAMEAMQYVRLVPVLLAACFDTDRSQAQVCEGGYLFSVALQRQTG
jgi:serine/threonine-protein kinase ATR